MNNNVIDKIPNWAPADGLIRGALTTLKNNGNTMFTSVEPNVLLSIMTGNGAAVEAINDDEIESLVELGNIKEIFEGLDTNIVNFITKAAFVVIRKLGITPEEVSEKDKIELLSALVANLDPTLTTLVA